MAGAYTCKIVQQDGTIVQSSIAGVNVDPMTTTLNDIGTASVRIPKDYAHAADVDLLDKEIQVFRDGTLCWWGAMVNATARSGDNFVTVQIPEPTWYLTRRQISDSRANQVLNPGFEDATSLNHWTAVGVTATRDTTHALLGTKAAKLVQASVATDTFLYQQVGITATAIGTLWTLVAYVWIDSATWVGGAWGGAYNLRGLYISRIVSSVEVEHQFIQIDDSTPKDQWVRLEVTRPDGGGSIWSPPNATETLEVRLYAPGGTVWWDGVQLVAMDSLSWIDADVATTFEDVVAFAQDSAHDWDDVNIATSGSATGYKVTRALQYTDHTDVMGYIGELVNQGFEHRLAITTTTRTLEYGMPVGTDRSGSYTFTLRSGGSGNVTSYDFSIDGSKTTTRYVVQGDGDGPDREEGFALDTSSLGGLTLGQVEAVSAPVSVLQRIADMKLAASKQLVRILTVVGLPGDSTQIGTLLVGDTVAVSISDGAVNLSGNWRIVQKTLDPKSDTASFVLNEDV